MSSARDAAAPVALGPRVVARHPLTPIQRDIWAAQRLHPEAPLANMGKRHRIRGPLDPERLVRAFECVVQAAPILRSVVGHDEMTVLARPPAPTHQLTLDPDQLDRWCADRIATPIDATTCCYDSVLLRHGDDDWTWWLDLHHLVTDAWSSALVFEATATAYEHLAAGAAPDTIDAAALALADLADVAPPDPDDPAHQRRVRAWEADAERFGDPSPFAPYGPRGRRGTEVDRLPIAHTSVTPSSLRAALADRYRSVTDEFALVGVLAAAVGAFAWSTDGRTSMTVGVPVHHRTGRTAPRVVGPMMEILPLRFEIADDDTFATLAVRVRAALLDVLKRARPGERPDTRVDVVVNVLHARYGSFAGMPTETEWMRSGHVEPGHVLRVQAYDYGGDDGAGELRLEADVQRHLDRDGWGRALPGHLARLLAAAIDRPDVPLAEIELVGPDDADALATLNPPLPPGAAARDLPVHEAIRRRLRANPDAVVVDHDGVRWSAADLDQLADRVAAAVDGRGAGGRRIGVRLRRSAELLAAVHGVLRAGSAFVMLDPDDPPNRHEEIAADAELAFVIDDVAELVEGHDPATDAPDGDLDAEAYVLYTSGSTGAPKGVPISHRGLADYLAFAVDAYVTGRGLTGADVVMPFHSRTVFDLTVTSMFLPMLVGGLTVVVDGDGLDALTAVAADERLTVLKATPSQLELLARMTELRPELHTVIVGGEAFRRPVALAFAARCADGAAVFNEYGPTEAVVGCMIHRFDPDVDRGADVPIGAACPGAEVHVLDHTGRRAVPGAWGELYVARPGMATGYLGRPELTAERFVHLPAVSDRLLYRTGDRARLERPGVLVFGGRLDDQLKVGGVRLEPGEVEAALVAHPKVDNALVRLWRHRPATVRHCVRCGLGDDVPGVSLDATRVCTVCHRFDAVAPQTDAWFRDDGDLARRLESARARRSGDIDALHLLSGGKDSTYALYQLVERGWRVHALTLDNGYLSPGAIENIRRTVADLGITHEFARTDAMAEIFRDSLERYANVCNGCYKAIYTIAIARARELGIPTIVTGLSRGQFFETRLVPHQFESGRFDADAIDATVAEARRVYHATRDAVTELLPEQSVFDDGDPLAEIDFVDFYRYVDVELAELYAFLEERAPWVRPADTGRSTNCLINDVGIWVHRHERGYHNYAEPYAWDVRLGHKTRSGALDELDDELDDAEIARMLAEIGYEPKTEGVLTAWYDTVDGTDLDPAELRDHLRDRLPERSIPAAFVRIDEVPLAASAKIDVGALPAPHRFHRAGTAAVPPTGPTEERLVAIWSDVLGIDALGVTDDFFDLGGASLAALEVVARVDDELGIDLPDAAVFRHRTVAELAAEIDRRSGGHAGAPTSAGAIAPIAPDLPPPLSPGEEAMLLDALADPASTRYHVARHYRVRGELDADRLRDAVHAVAARHEPLHRAFDASRTPLAPETAVRFAPLDVDPTIDPGELDRLVERLAAEPFDLRTGPLVRVHAGPTSPGEWSVLVVLHHISIDAETFDLLWAEITAAYRGEPLPELHATVASHAAWQRSRSVDHAGFWSAHRREHAAPAVALPPVRVAEPDGYLQIDASISPTELRGGPGTTPFATALAAAALALGRWARDGRVPLGVTASTKDHPAARPLIGYYLNTLPLTIDVSSDPNRSTMVADVARQASGVIESVIERRTYPFAEMVRDARRDGEAEPAIAHLLAYQQLAPADVGPLRATHRILPSGSSVAEVTLFVEERPDSVRLGIEHRGSVVGRDTAARVLADFGAALEALCRDPAAPVGSVFEPDTDLVGPDDDDAGGTVHTVVDRIVAAATADPTATAVVAADGELSYAEVVGRGVAIADALRSHLDGTSGRVGIAVRRTSHLVPAIVGALLAGAAYVPLDPAMPRTRLRELVGAADLDVVIADAGSAALAPHGVPVVPAETEPASDATAHADALGRASQLAAAVAGDDPAYVIFTSGSTGRPAGILATHANLASSTSARAAFYGDAPADRPERFLSTSSIGFDSSLVGLFWPLATGATIVLAGDDDVHDVDRLGALVAEHEVTHVLMVPALYRAVLARRGAVLGSLRVSIVAGEACPDQLVHEHARVLPTTRLVNEYGPTETTVWASAADLVPGHPVTIGHPIAGTRLRVASADGRALPTGAVGELWIAGRGVTAGYVGGTGRDAFVDVDGRRWYRTGDLVRSGADGLEYLGRIDDQLNVGGARLEPAELETALRDQPGIAEAVVVAHRTGPDRGAPGERADAVGRELLVAHVERSGAGPDVAAVRAVLADRFPAAIVPRQVIVHDRLPRNVHGKLDRAAAAALPLERSRPSGEEADADADTDRPSTVEVAAMIAIWNAALGRDDVEADTDFFAAGGDSLAAVEIVTAAEERTGAQVEISALLVAPTPAAFVARLTDGRGPADDRPAPADRSAHRAAVDLVRLRPGVEGGPVVVMTAAWDDVFGYQPLAEALPDDIGVVALARAGDDPRYDLVDAFSEASLAVLDDAGLAVPDLVLVGWSIGGVVAFELGTRLAESGRTPRTIALVDTYFPGEHRHRWANRWSKYRSLVGTGATRHVAGELTITLRRRVGAFRAAIGRARAAFRGEEVPAVPAHSPGGIPYAARDHELAPSSVPTVLYAASATNRARTERRWVTVATDLEVVPVQGRHRGHHSVMDVERVHQIADHLTARIRDGAA